MRSLCVRERTARISDRGDQSRVGYATLYKTVPSGGTLPNGWKLPAASTTITDIAYGSGATQLLDLYLPDATAFPGPRPIIVWLHAGGWESGDRTQTNDVIQREYTRGYAVASVEYALSPGRRFPTALHDVKLAIRYLKANRAAYNLDGRVIAAGGSAGGNLALLVGLTPGQLEPPDLLPKVAAYNDKVVAVIDLVGPSDFSTFSAERGSIGDFARSMTAKYLHCTIPAQPKPLACPAGLMATASAPTHVNAHAPPVFMAYGGSDTLVPPKLQAIPLAKRWANAKHNARAVWLQVVAAAGHNLSVHDVNNRYLDEFLDGAVTGTVR
jgi:acetyl esterase/lipase